MHDGLFEPEGVVFMPKLIESIILAGLLWLGGQALEAAFPELLKAKILITFPNS
jgi:hypothetical protein